MATANFTLPGLRPPQAAEMETLALQEAMLAKQLAESQQGLAPAAADAGRYKALNLEGVANALLGSKLRSKQGDVQGKRKELDAQYQQGLAQALQQLDPESVQALRAAAMSPYPEVRARAAEAMKVIEERFKSLAPRASFPSVQQAGGDPSKLAPKIENKLVDGVAVAEGEGQIPTRVGSPLKQETLSNGTVVQTSPITGKMDAVDKAPKITTNVAAPGVKKLLDVDAEKLAEKGAFLGQTVPAMMRAIRDAEAVNGKAIQGTAAVPVQAIAGVLTQMGMASKDVQAALANTEALSESLGKLVLARIKELGPNPSNADRVFAEETLGNKRLSPAGLKRVLAAAREDIQTAVKQHNFTITERMKKSPDYEVGLVKFETDPFASTPVAKPAAALSPAEAARKAQLERLGLPYTPPGGP